MIKNKDRMGYWITLFMIISFNEPEYFNNYQPVISNIYTAMKAASVGLLAIYVLYKSKVSYLLVCTSFFYMTRIASSVVNGGNVFNAISLAIVVVGFCMMVEYGVETNAKSFIKNLTVWLILLAIINIILFFIFPEGLTGPEKLRRNFLHHDNDISNVLIPLMTISIINYFINKTMENKYLAYFAVGLSIITIIIIWPATGLVGLAVFLLHLAFINKKKIYHVLNIKTVTIVSILAFIGIVLFKLQNVFSFFIVKILRKDLTLSNRTIVWNRAYNVITDLPEEPTSFLLGFGNREEHLLAPFGHSHNEIFEIILRSGYLGLLTFVILLFVCCRKLWIHRDNPIAYVITSSLFAFFIMSIAETVFGYYFFIILALAFNIDKLSLDNNREIGVGGSYANRS